VALVGLGGRVTVDSGRTLIGRFEAGVLQDSTPVGLAGRFEGLSVVERCP